MQNLIYLTVNVVFLEISIRSSLLKNVNLDVSFVSKYCLSMNFPSTLLFKKMLIKNSKKKHKFL